MHRPLPSDIAVSFPVHRAISESFAEHFVRDRRITPSAPQVSSYHNGRHCGGGRKVMFELRAGEACDSVRSGARWFHIDIVVDSRAVSVPMTRGIDPPEVRPAAR
ncbi:hypothetical protein MRX96_040101 [Rhipicephalus microplus]